MILQEENLNTNSDNKEMAFTMGELWAFPLMLKIAIIINLSKYTHELVNIQKEILNGKNVAERIIDAINNNKLDEEIDNINIDHKYENISPLFLREFFRVLRDNSIEDKRIDDFIEIKMENKFRF